MVSRKYFQQLERAEKTMKSKDWLLIIGALLIGLTIHEIGQLRRPFWLDYSLGRYSGPYFVSNENKEISIPENGILEIVGNVGSISIHGSKDKKTVIRWDKLIYETNKANAEKIAHMLTIGINQIDNRIQISTNAEALENSAGKSIKNNYEIWIPMNTNLHLQNKMGNLIIENMNSFVDIKNSFGDITLLNTRNQCLIAHSFGVLTISNVNGFIQASSDYSKIDASGIKGNLRLTSQYAKVAMTDIDASVALDFDYGIFEGRRLAREMNIVLKHTQLIAKDSSAKFIINSAFSNVSLSAIRNDITISSRYSPIGLDDIDGKVYIVANFKEVVLRNINGWCQINANHAMVQAQKLFAGLKIDNSFEDVILEDVYGKIIINNHHSDVKMQVHQSRFIDFTANVKYGNIEFQMPESFEFNLTGNAYNGDIDNSFSKELLIQNESEDYAKIESKFRNPSSSHIDLNTQYGDITLKKEMKTIAWVADKLNALKEKTLNKAQQAQNYIIEKVLNEMLEYGYYQIRRLTLFND